MTPFTALRRATLADVRDTALMIAAIAVLAALLAALA